MKIMANMLFRFSFLSHFECNWQTNQQTMNHIAESTTPSPNSTNCLVINLSFRTRTKRSPQLADGIDRGSTELYLARYS